MRSAGPTALVVLLALACSGADEPDAGAWEFKVDTTRSSTWLRVVGSEGPDGKPRTEAVLLSFDCLPDDAPSTIMTEQSLRQGTTEVRLALDGGAPQALEAFAGTTPSGGQVVLRIPQDSVLQLLRRHQTALVSYEDGAGSSKTSAEFPLQGLETYYERFLEACRELSNVGER